jgi:hypothetical protein
MRTISLSRRRTVRGGSPRVPRTLLACGALAAMALVAWASPAAAKGPTPAAPEPSGPLTSGETTEIVVQLEWQGGNVPAGFGPESYEMWGDDLPWDLLAVPGSTASSGAIADVERLSLSNQGGGRYTATFTPTIPGDWNLVIATDAGTGRWNAFLTKPVRVADSDGGTSTAALAYVIPGFVVVAALGGGAVFLRRRRTALASVP